MRNLRTIFALLMVAVGLTLTGCGNSPQQLADAFPCSQSMKVSDPADLDRIVESTFPQWFVSNSRSFSMESSDFKSEWRRLILIRSGVSEPVVAGTDLMVPVRCQKGSSTPRAEVN